MGEEIREFVAGDKITITTTLEHEANIAGINVYYLNEDESATAPSLIGFSKGATQIGSPDAQSSPLPGPYLAGEITLETILGPRVRPGTYRLQTIELITAGHQRIYVEELQLPEDRIRVLHEPTDPPHIDQWDVGGEYQT